MASNQKKVEALRILGLELEEALGSELIRQGHRLTGALIQSISVKIFERFDSLGLEGIFNDYGIFLDTGVSKDKIPFSGATGRGGKSLYITGLINWVRLKFKVNAKKAKGIAFAIAHTHKKKGMPAGGDKFKGWMTKTLNAKERRISDLIGAAAEQDIVIVINNIVTGAQKIILA